MKKLIALVIAVVLVLAMVVPALAAPPPTVTTVVNIDGGTSALPTIKVKWEQSSLNSNGATTPTTYGNVNPPLTKCGWVQVDYYAVVTGPQPLYGNLSNVFAYVYSPVGSPPPYNSLSDPPEGDIHPNFKYKVDFTPITDIATAVGLFNAVPPSALTYGMNPNPSPNGTLYTAADILLELNKPEATLWHGVARLTYEQPAGAYIVDVYGITAAGKTSTIPSNPYVVAPFEALENTFTYNPVPYIAIDFTSLSYGNVTTGVDTWVNGDTQMANPPDGAGIGGNGYPAAPPKGATVENIGNTWASIDIWQDDMGFGQTDVLYDYKMGNATALINQVPNMIAGVPQGPGHILPNSLGLSMLDELDFSILVVQPVIGQNHYTGKLKIAANYTPFNTPAPNITGLADPCVPPLPWPPVPIWP